MEWSIQWYESVVSCRTAHSVNFHTNKHTMTNKRLFDFWFFIYFFQFMVLKEKDWITIITLWNFWEHMTTDVNKGIRIHIWILWCQHLIVSTSSQLIIRIMKFMPLLEDLLGRCQLMIQNTNIEMQCSLKMDIAKILELNYKLIWICWKLG